MVKELRVGDKVPGKYSSSLLKRLFFDFLRTFHKRKGNVPKIIETCSKLKNNTVLLPNFAQNWYQYLMIIFFLVLLVLSNVYISCLRIKIENESRLLIQTSLITHINSKQFTCFIKSIITIIILYKNV